MDRTLGDALLSARSRLSSSSTAESDAEELVSRLVGMSRAEIHIRREEPLPPELWQRLDSWLRRRAAGQPIQYITGRAAFRSLDLTVDDSVLIPRPETEQLVEAVISVLRDQLMHWPMPRILDLGTGSGAIALSLAREWPQAKMFATDASESALATARANAEALGLGDRVEFRLGHWLDAVGGDERFEVIVSNPPYIALGETEDLPVDVRDHEPHLALFAGESGNEALREILDDAPRHMVAGGLLALELAEARAREVASWLEGARDWCEVELRDDLAGRPRILLARRERGPAIAPAQWEEERS
jgi:release factor glutamine methyltransferase